MEIKKVLERFREEELRKRRWKKGKTTTYRKKG